MSVELTILVDDNTDSDTMRCEHGLAILIDGPDKRFLFDTAATPETLLANANCIGLQLDTIDGVIISHGHYDHTGALSALAEQHGELNVYAHPSAFLQRWVDRPGQPLKDISCPHSLTRLCQRGVVFHSIKHPEMLAEWLILSGPIGGPRHGNEMFVMKKSDDMILDGFEDEIFCLVRGENGWSLITGCCHRGMKNTLRLGQFLTHGDPINAVVGGLHLHLADTAELAETVELLKSFNCPHLYPCHCTGQHAVDYLSQHLGDHVHPVSAGSKITV